MSCKLWIGLVGVCLALAACSVPHDLGTPAPEACGAGVAGDSEECAAQGDALLQHASRMDLGNIESLDEDSDSGSEAVGASETSLSSWLTSLLSGGTVASAKAKVAADGRSVVVSFRHGGKAMDYRLAAFSVYADGAEVLAHTATGVEKRPVVDGKVRTFKARDEDNEHGLWASVTLAGDGLVTGLFQVESGVVRLEPVGRGLDGQDTAALLEVSDVKGMENPHLVRSLNMSLLASGEPLTDAASPLGAALRQQQGAAAGKPCVKIDGECVHTGGDDLRDGIQHVPKMDPNESEAPLLSGQAAWKGVKWWPGCYGGDSKLHDFKVGVVVDHDGFQEHGSAVKQKMEAAFVESSFVYEHQLHIKLSIGHMKIYESSSGAPSYAVGCSPVLKLEAFKAKAAQDIPRGLGAAHMFTGCGTGYGAVGVAWVGTICRTDGYSTGVNQFHKTRDWLTFAHELGHNFAGKHSFEEGQGKTGGIMDYGDGKLNGIYQFHTKYRKQEMCRMMGKAVNNCNGGFDPAKNAPSPPPPPPPSGSPSPPSGSPSPPGTPLDWKKLEDKLDDLEDGVKEAKEEVEILKKRRGGGGGSPSPPPPPGTPPSPPPPGTPPSPPPPGTPPSPAPAKPDAEEWVSRHNYWRCIHGSPEIAWDTDTAKGAQSWADKGVFKSSGTAGENMALIGGGSFLLETEDEDELADSEEAEDEFAEVAGASVTVYNGARIIIRDDAEVVGDGKMYRWVITIPKGCTNEDLKKLTDQMPNGTTPEFEGDPDHGGLCVFIMDGTEDDVKEEIASHTWPSTPTFETDSEWSFIPEVPEEGTGHNPDVSEGPELLEVDGKLSQPNPPSWGLDRVDDREGLDSDYTPPNTGAGVHVYVADTGIMTTHKDFGGRAIPTLEVLSSNRKVCSSSDTSCANDRQGHGTHCAGTIGGASYGVAKGATLHAVKVLSDSGSGSFSWFIEALDWVMASGSKPSVFSASLGGKGKHAAVKTSIDKAVAAGVIVVVAAGNSRADACGFSPAYVPSAITVAATEKGDARAGYSCFGSCIDIFAPGSKIVSAGVKGDSSSDTMSGTSMACPHVAGGAALLLAEDSSRTPAQVLKVMLERATNGKVTDPRSGSPNKLLFTGAPAPPPPPPPSKPSPNAAAINKTVSLWYNESPEKGPKCGANCTAMLWKAASKIGCGINKKAPGGTLMVCRYGGGTPLPNTAGAFDANVGFPDMKKEPECNVKYLKGGSKYQSMKDQLKELKDEITDAKSEMTPPVDKTQLKKQLGELKTEVGETKKEIDSLKSALR